MWSLNVFIDFPLLCRQVKNQPCQGIRIRPAVQIKGGAVQHFQLQTYSTLLLQERRTRLLA